MNACDATGSANAYACTFTPAITAYVSNQCFLFKANHTNTGAATLNINGIGAKMIKKYVAGSPQDVVANDIGNGQQVNVCYDGANMQVQSIAPPGGGPGGTGDITAVGTNCTTGACGDTVTPFQGMIWSPIAEPATPSTAQAHSFVRSAEKIWCVKDDAGGVSCTVRNKAVVVNEFLTGLSNGVISSAQPSFSNLSGTASATQLPNPTVTTKGGVQSRSCLGIGHIESINTDGSVTCTADGTSGGTFSAVGNCTGGSCGTASPGTALTSFSWSPIATPATPASGRATQFVSLNKTMAVINDAGVVTHGVQDCPLTANNWIQVLNTDGSCQKAQPAFSNLTGTASSAQMPAVMSATKVKPLSKQLSDDNSIDDITVDTCDICYLSTLSQATTFQAPTGTPAEGQYLELRITSAASGGQALTWVTTTNGYSGNAGVTLPARSTGSNFEDHFTFRWNGTAQRWVLTGSTVLSAPLDSSALLPKLRTKTCMMVLGDDDSAATALTDVKLTQLEQCLASVAQTVKEITVKSVGGAATVQVHRRTGTTNTALHTGSITAGTCTRASGDATGIDGTTCFTTLTAGNIVVPAGAWIGLTSGVANGARRVSVAVTTWVN